MNKYPSTQYNVLIDVAQLFAHVNRIVADRDEDSN